MTISNVHDCFLVGEKCWRKTESLRRPIPSQSFAQSRGIWFLTIKNFKPAAGLLQKLLVTVRHFRVPINWQGRDFPTALFLLHSFMILRVTNSWDGRKSWANRQKTGSGTTNLNSDIRAPETPSSFGKILFALAVHSFHRQGTVFLIAHVTFGTKR